ncbi:MAG TPA: hypothetical protein VIU64_01150, partial [Polyangia bacterium]
VLASCHAESQRQPPADASASGGAGGAGGIPLGTGGVPSTGGIHGTGGISATGGNIGTGLGPELCGLHAGCVDGVVYVSRWDNTCNPEFSVPCDHGCKPDAGAISESSVPLVDSVGRYVADRLCLGPADDAGVGGEGGVGGVAGEPGGVGGAGGAPADAAEYRACELVADLERVDLFRIDRAAGLCMEVTLLQTSSSCPLGVSQGGWCVSQAHVHTDLAACDKFLLTISSVATHSNASAARGTVAVSRVNGTPTFTKNLTLTFPPVAGLPTTAHVAAADCLASCAKTDCRATPQP